MSGVGRSCGVCIYICVFPPPIFPPFPPNSILPTGGSPDSERRPRRSCYTCPHHPTHTSGSGSSSHSLDPQTRSLSTSYLFSTFLRKSPHELGRQRRRLRLVYTRWTTQSALIGMEAQHRPQRRLPSTRGPPTRPEATLVGIRIL